jgi:hypothetical protein
MPTVSRERLVRTGLVVALLAGLLAATFAAGYRSSAEVLDTATDFLHRDPGIERVNWETGDVDAVAALELADDKDLLDVVQVSPDVVHIVNTRTGEYWLMRTDTMRPELTSQGSNSGGQPNDADGAGGQAYLLDGDSGRIAVLEGRGGAPTGDTELPADVRVDQFVVDSSGNAWALSVAQGELYLLDGITVVAQHPVADPGEPVLLTLADDQPIVYLPRRGFATMYEREGELRRVYGLPTVESPENVEVSFPGADARILIVVVRRSGEILKVDFADGDVSASRLGGRDGNRFGPPAVAHDLVYLPDYDGPHVLVLDLDSLEEIREPVRVPRSGVDFQVVARDGRVWVNDPYGALLSFDEHGRHRRVDQAGGEESDRDGPHGTEADQPGPEQPESQQPGREESEQPETEEPPEEPRQDEDVTVRVPNTVDMPYLEACAVLQETGLKCAFEPRSDAAGDAGLTIETRPPAGERVRAGSEVTIVYPNGQNTVRDYVGEEISAACAEVQGEGQQFACEQVEGVTDVNKPCGIVYGQAPPVGAGQDIGISVTLTYYSCNQDLPSYVGGIAQQACGDINARGFQCVEVHNPYPGDPNVVAAQDQPAGRYPLGSAITIHYSRWTVVDWWAHQWENGWLLREGPPPAGVNGFQVGGGYGAGADIPGAQNINEFMCTAGDRQCRDLDTNVFYSKLPPGHPSVDPEFTAVTPAAVFMPCTGANRPVWRVWNGGGPRYYVLSLDDPAFGPPPGLPLPNGTWDSELLGCVW